MKLKNIPDRPDRNNDAKSSSAIAADSVVSSRHEFKAPQLLGELFSKPSEMLIEAKASSVSPNIPAVASPTAVVDDETLESADGSDERQIEGSLEGRYIDQFVYEFCGCNECPKPPRYKVGTCPRFVRSLSWMGIQEASRELRITIEPGFSLIMHDDKGQIVSQFKTSEKAGVVIAESPSYIRAFVTATNPATGLSRMGASKAAKRKTFPNGGQKDDPFAEQKAISKAERNALRQHLPQMMIKAWIDKFLENRKAEEAKMPPAPSYAIAPKDDPQQPHAETHKGLLFDQTIEKLEHALSQRGVTDMDLSDIRSVITTAKDAQGALRGVMAGRIADFKLWYEQCESAYNVRRNSGVSGS